MIYKKYIYIFGPSDDQNKFLLFLCGLHTHFLVHSFPKPWNFLTCKNYGIIFTTVFGHLSSVSGKCFWTIKLKWMSCHSYNPLFHRNWVYVNEVTSGKHPRTGTGCLGKLPWLEDWNFQFHPRFSREVERLEVESITNSQWVNQSCLHKNPKGESSESFQVKESECFQVLPCQAPSSQSTEDSLFRTSLHTICISSSGCWFVFLNILYNKSVIEWINRSSWVPWAILAN